MNSNIINRIHVLIKKTYYTHDRFKVPATFAMLYHEEPLNVIDFSKHIRISDQVMQLDLHHYFIIFAFTPSENAYKASQNIIHSLDNHFNNRTSYIVTDSFDSTRSPQSVVNRLEQILAETRKNPYVRIETEEILDRR